MPVFICTGCGEKIPCVISTNDNDAVLPTDCPWITRATNAQVRMITKFALLGGGK